VVGLYLNPPANAVVVTMAGRSPAPADSLAGLVPPPRPGQAGGRAFNHVFNVGGTLSGALEVATGRVSAQGWYPRHREFLGFLEVVASAHPGELRVVLDNDGTPDHPEVRSWLGEAANQRISLHFTTAICSWLNMVEIFFGIAPHQALHRAGGAAGEPVPQDGPETPHGVEERFRSVKDLVAAIGRFIETYNDRCQPFTWSSESAL
jgi:hypothetical protein